MMCMQWSPPERAEAVHTLLAQHLQRHVHIQLNSGKPPPSTARLHQLPQTFLSGTWVGHCQFPPEQEGFIVLGVPLGSPEFVQHQLHRTLADHAPLLHQFPHFNDL